MSRFRGIAWFHNVFKFSSRLRYIKIYSPSSIRLQKLIVRNFHLTRVCNLATENASTKTTLVNEKSVAVEEPIPQDVLIEKLLKCSSLSDQMLTLSSTLVLSQEDIEQRHLVAQQVKDMLNPFFENFDIRIFGSSVNGFGFKGCDIDMVLVSHVDPENVRNDVFDDSNIPTSESVLNGKVPRSYMDCLSPRDQLLFMHTVFLDYYRDCEIAPTFIGAHIPIVRFNYDPYHLKVDLTCGNNLGIINSKLLNAFRLFDSRIAPFIMTIRYWAKCTGLIGKGMVFNSYCLTLLAVYFLQTRKLPVLPAVEYMLSVVGDEIHSLDMSEESCNRIVKAVPPTQNTQSLGELLREFFFYYLYFDFSHVICPVSASPKRREEFAHCAEAKKFKFNTICVQDPINLTHNVSNLVDYRHCRKFAKELLSVCQLFRHDRYMIPGDSNWGLTALFDRPEEFSINFHNNLSNTLELSIPLNSLEKNSMSIAHSVFKVLEYTLLFKCDNLQTDKNLDGNDDDKRLLMLFKCSGETNTWLGRDCVAVDTVSDDVLSSERTISLTLSQRKEKNCSFGFICKLYGTKHNSEGNLVLKLQSITNKPINPILGIFLQEYLPKILTKLQ